LRTGTLSLLLLAAVLPSASAPQEVASTIRIRHAATADTVSRVLEGAARRLRQSRCQRIFEEFSDARGRPLREALGGRGGDGAAYLSTLIFYDGTPHPSCARKDTLALTGVGSRVVLICPTQFRAMWRVNPFVAEAALIHEALHTLGLGEDPPSSREITASVVRACRF
jgi:hypothetical protein